MERYINVPIQMYPSSTATNAAGPTNGTTDAATAGKLTDTATTFISDGIVAGDYAVITTGIAGYPIRTWSLITAVDSETVLSISGAGSPDTGTGGLSASGTDYEVIAAADVSKCVLSGATFTENVSVGDVVCNTDTNLNYTVASVVDDETLILSGINFGILLEMTFLSYPIKGFMVRTR